MKTSPVNALSVSLEEQLQQKIKEYNIAEESGKSHEELNAIYQQIKDLKYQLSVEKKLQ